MVIKVIYEVYRSCKFNDRLEILKMEIWGNSKNGSVRKVVVSFHRNVQLIMTTGYGVPCRGSPGSLVPCRGSPASRLGARVCCRTQPSGLSQTPLICTPYQALTRLIFTDSYRFFRLSWETSTLKNYPREVSAKRVLREPRGGPENLPLAFSHFLALSPMSA